MNRRGDTLGILEGEFELLVIGGGATGLGIAVDAATRGYRTVLVESGDFAQATSSRATKLIHGGVRYLASGQFPLVYEALHERKVALRNAPHLVQKLQFLIPVYKRFHLPWYAAALKLYDILSGSSSLGATRILSAKETRQRIPGIAARGLRGSVMYNDAQFDDARLALALARTAADHGALVVNYVRCTELLKYRGKLVGAHVQDVETRSRFEIHARAVINATGIFADALREQDSPGSEKLLSLSRGTHIVAPAEVLGSNNAITVPRTRDGRIIFAIPWLGRVIIGTTDVSAPLAKAEPGYETSEIDFLLETINPYLESPINRVDILSVFSGLRPLVTGKESNTSRLSREHHIEISPSGLVTVAGGKWTTYRRMAEDTIDFAIRKGLLPHKACVSRTIKLHGAPTAVDPPNPLSRYGTDAVDITQLYRDDPSLLAALDDSLPYTMAEVVYAVREEMARTVEDVLSRRTRALLLDARAAQRAAPRVAIRMAHELSYGPEWVKAQIKMVDELAERYYVAPGRNDRNGPK